MYEQHWHLSRPAFRSSAPAEFFFPSRGHTAAILKLHYLVEQQQGIAVVTGASGMGKSCVLDAFCHQRATAAGPVIPVLFPQMSSAELLGFLTSKLEAAAGATPSDANGLDHVLQRLERQLIHFTQQQQHPILLIDDAHLITDRRVFQTLQLLLNYHRADRIEFSIILAGQPELIGQIKRYPALLDRLAFISSLTPLAPEETAAYVRHRIEAAGGSPEIFEEDALGIIHQLSGGLPRRINRLCDFALLIGYADNLDQVSPAQIEAVAEELTLAA